MKTLALDLGERRIGVAISDPMGIIAQGYGTLDGRDEPSEIIGKLKEIITMESVNEVVVGLPLNMDGSEGRKAKEVLEFAEKLRTDLGIVVKTQDERLTTMQVERVMIEADTSRDKRRKKIDKLAAQVILQTYLDSVNIKKESENA